MLDVRSRKEENYQLIDKNRWLGERIHFDNDTLVGMLAESRSTDNQSRCKMLSSMGGKCKSIVLSLHKLFILPQKKNKVFFFLSLAAGCRRN